MHAEPFFFGAKNAEMFGVYHAPATVADRDVGVVIAPPFGPELLKSHRALRQLALRLSRAGFHVLRFDFRGCGDSAGGPEPLDLEAWTSDVGVAIDELKDRSGVSRVALAGLRLGATVGLLAGVRRRDVEALVLWEPILDGPAHLAELAQKAADWRSAERLEAPGPAEGEITEIMGFIVGPPLRRSLSALSLELQRRPARRVLLLVEDEPLAPALRLIGDLRRLGTVPEERRVPEARSWLDVEKPGRALVPQAAIGSVAGWLSGEAA